MPPEPPESPGRRHRAAVGILVLAVAFGVALVVDLAVDGRWLDVLLLACAAVLIGVSYRLQAYARERLVYRPQRPDQRS